MAEDGGRRHAGVMGSPIAHSLSPTIHRAAYASLGLAGWTYAAQEVDAAGLPAALGGCGPDWAGVSLTMPLKHAVLPLLDSISDLAAAVGAVNTVTFGSAGRAGDNTDVHGIVAALRSAGASAPGGAVVLGGGATAASALAALRELGDEAPVVAVRSAARAQPLLAAAERLGVTPRLAAWDTAGDLLRQAPVVVSTAPPGAADSVIPVDLRTDGVLLDVVYRPWPTPLAVAWTRAGGRAVPGLDMLVHQAAAQVHRWTGRSPDLAALHAAALAATRDDPA